jgi:preprotein translocase subunit SecE
MIKNIFNKITTFLKEVKMEMKKVNWLTKEETIRYTLIVIIISAILAIFLGTLDFLLIRFLNQFIL